MVDKKVNESGDIGMIGLGVMGRNFALNVADHGVVVVGFDRDTEKTTGRPLIDRILDEA
jgi:6-phosphogluconate dehydrogenase